MYINRLLNLPYFQDYLPPPFPRIPTQSLILALSRQGHWCYSEHNLLFHFHSPYLKGTPYQQRALKIQVLKIMKILMETLILMRHPQVRMNASQNRLSMAVGTRSYSKLHVSSFISTSSWNHHTPECSQIYNHQRKFIFWSLQSINAEN